MHMQLRLTVFVVPFLLLVGCVTTDQLNQVLRPTEPLDTETVVAGLKEALRVGSQRAADFAAREGAYSDTPWLRIPIPDKLDGVTDKLRAMGLGNYVDRFERRMNAAAEEAAAQAAPVFIDAVRDMTIADAQRILQGGDTAATDYFRARTEERLRELYAPVIESQLTRVGAVQAYNDVMARYNAIPLVPKPEFTLEEYVTDEALDGLYTALAREETRIREEPVARTTELLRRVFGNRTGW